MVIDDLPKFMIFAAHSDKRFLLVSEILSIGLAMATTLYSFWSERRQTAEKKVVEEAISSVTAKAIRLNERLQGNPTVEIQAGAEPVDERDARDRTQLAGSPGYGLLKVVAVTIATALAILLSVYAFMHWHVVVTNPEQVLKIALATTCMFAGILVDLLVSFTNSSRELTDIQRQEVLVPFAVSFLIFYGLWTHLVDTQSVLTACYNAFTSGLTWRRILAMVQDSVKK